ncbi:MAG: citrate lyase beta subunit [Bacteroidetes bacterium]|nr:citrate lyase beta subunit [Bacteroidota bacterium]
MTSRENRMIDILIDLKENHNVIGVKAEFEAEGTRLEEALRLKEVVTKANLDLTIKIGGCEAIKDMYDARSIGVTKIVAPMVESAYAMKKFIYSFQKAFTKEERDEMKFFINVETFQTIQKIDEILESDYIADLDGIVLGRVDLTGSLGMSREDINSKEVFDLVYPVFQKAKAKGLLCAIGGGVSKESIPFFRDLPQGTPDYFETRKVLFKCPESLSATGAAGILKAVGFELMWLKNKRDFYEMIYNEDSTRIKMLEERYKHLIEEAGGYVS